MDEITQKFWQFRLEAAKAALEKNNFVVYLAADKQDAAEIVKKEILGKTDARTLAWGGSKTFVSTGLYHYLKDAPQFDCIDSFDSSISQEEKTERRRQSLLADLFFTSTNAITESGQLVNQDMIGNRIGALTFGPKEVVLLIGRNKLVADEAAARARIRQYVAPANALRLGMKTPCVKTGFCQDCRSPGRICNTWTITEKAFPEGRVKIVLINQDLGI